MKLNIKLVADGAEWPAELELSGAEAASMLAAASEQELIDTFQELNTALAEDPEWRARIYSVIGKLQPR